VYYVLILGLGLVDVVSARWLYLIGVVLRLVLGLGHGCKKSSCGIDWKAKLYDCKKSSCCLDWKTGLGLDALLPCHALLRHLTTMQLFMGRFFFGGFGPQKTVDTKVKLVISLSFCSTALKL